MLAAARTFPTAIALAGVLVAWVIGVRGIDFGRHWDEPRLMQALRHAGETRTLLPGWYNYPSLSFDIILAAASTEIAVGALRDGRLPSAAEWGGKVSGRAESPAFLLRMRTLFLTLTLLTAIWAGLLAWTVTRERWPAVIATLLVAFSWEVGYHARWIAPDGLMMQWGVLTILLAVLSRTSPARRTWLLLAAATAALTFSSKYTGGVVLMPVLALAVFDRRREESTTAKLTHLVAVCAIFIAIAVLLTPAFVLDPAAVLRDISYERHHYGVLGHYGHDTNGWFDHTTLIARYLATAALSPWTIPGAAFAVLAVVGLVALARRRPVEASVLVAAPVVLALYLSTQRAMVVRNLLLVVPFMAVLAATGAMEIVAVLQRRGYRLARPVLLTGIASVLAANAAWGVHASQTIRDRHNRDWEGELRTRARAELVMFNTDCDWSAWPANRVPYQLLPSGPFEVNWTYYPGWWGDPRIVIVPSAALDWPALRDCARRR